MGQKEKAYEIKCGIGGKDVEQMKERICKGNKLKAH